MCVFAKAQHSSEILNLLERRLMLHWFCQNTEIGEKGEVMPVAVSQKKITFFFVSEEM